MTEETFKSGDVVGFVFGQPGNDTTYIVLTAVRANDADGWDLFFDMKLTELKLSKLWLATERELDIRGVFATGKPATSVRKLADDARQRLGVGG